MMQNGRIKDARYQRDDELKDLLFEQDFAADREFHEKQSAWRLSPSTPTTTSERWRRRVAATPGVVG